MQYKLMLYTHIYNAYTVYTHIQYICIVYILYMRVLVIIYYSFVESYTVSNNNILHVICTVFTYTCTVPTYSTYLQYLHTVPTYSTYSMIVRAPN